MLAGADVTEEAGSMALVGGGASGRGGRGGTASCISCDGGAGGSVFMRAVGGGEGSGDGGEGSEGAVSGSYAAGASSDCMEHDESSVCVWFDHCDVWMLVP